MTEEVKTEEVKEPEAPVAPTAIEQRALDMGWRPRTEYHGDEEDFIDAKEFVNRKPLFDKIESLKGAVQNNAQTVKALIEHNAKIEKAAYERAIKELRAEQKKAIDDGDMSKYHELQEEIDETKASPPTVPEVPTQAAVPPEVQNWIARNSWYAKDHRMKAAADAIGLEGNEQGLRGQPLLDFIEKEVRKEFPHKFTNPNQARAAAVEGSGGGKASGAKSSDDSYPLNDQEKRIMNTLVSSKTMTKAEYIKQLKQAKGEA
jgi:hypothetical protein